MAIPGLFLDAHKEKSSVPFWDGSHSWHYSSVGGHREKEQDYQVDIVRRLRLRRLPGTRQTL